MIRGFFRRIGQLLTGASVSPETYETLEEILVAGDVGVTTASAVIQRLEREVRARGADAAQAREILQGILAEILSRGQAPLVTEPPDGAPVVYLVMGVNGTGKTTTIAKLAHRFKSRNRRVLLAAADTFRAAATEQLEVWGQRVGCDVIKHKPGADPGAVIFDAIAAARARGAQMVIADTAGRLHTQRNLMEELKKIGRVAERALGRPADERLLVLDATTGQNALVQARTFAEAVGVTGIVITKLDGTAKGGTVIAIADATGLPIKLAGTGEKLDDLEDFDPRAYVESLFESST